MFNRNLIDIETTTQEEAESNDSLIAIRVDGDITQNNKVRYEFGTLNSEDASIIGAMPVTIMKWENVDSGAVPAGGGYVIDTEPPDAGDVASFINGSFEDQYKARTELSTSDQRKAAKRATGIYVGVVTVCIIISIVGLIALPMWNTYIAGRVATDAAIDRMEWTDTTAPTPAPAPTPETNNEEEGETPRPIPRPRSRSSDGYGHGTLGEGTS